LSNVQPVLPTGELFLNVMSCLILAVDLMA